MNVNISKTKRQLCCSAIDVFLCEHQQFRAAQLRFLKPNVYVIAQQICFMSYT